MCRGPWPKGPTAVIQTATGREHFFKTEIHFPKPGPPLAVPRMGVSQKQWKNIWSTDDFGLTPYRLDPAADRFWQSARARCAKGANPVCTCVAGGSYFGSQDWGSGAQEGGRRSQCGAPATTQAARGPCPGPWLGGPQSIIRGHTPRQTPCEGV